MNKNIITIGISIIIIAIMIYFIKNSDEILNTLKNNKLIKLLIKILIVIILGIAIIFLYDKYKI